jgi:hypothetical protein
MMQPWPVSFAQVDQAYCNHLRVKRFLRDQVVRRPAFILRLSLRTARPGSFRNSRRFLSTISVSF